MILLTHNIYPNAECAIKTEIIMKLHDKLYGFTVEDVTEISAIDAVMYLLTHDKTGAKLCYLDRDDSSRTFAITFGTPPTDDTGVFHILEHSVLCGSDKFPTKEPFTELLKGSLNTFLNAMTYPDKTSYPVASRNDKDFYNLVDVYMDAVLHPKAVSDERIFRQEGWRYELTGEDSVGYNGVVYSEMRGIYSSPDSLAAYASSRLLFPGGTYSYDSGGHPDAIPTLSYQGFVDAHKKHYHPSGAYLFLDGKPKLDEILPLLDGYLKDYDRKEITYDIVRGGEIITDITYEKYEIEEGESPENKTRVYLTYLAGDFSDITAHSALAILTDAVADSNEAPLKKAILASGLCDNVYIYPSPGTKYATFNVEFRGVKDGKEKEIIAHFDKCAEELLACGIDKSLIRASRDRIEFKTREADFGSSPKGIVYLSAINDVWLYGMHPAAALDHNKIFGELSQLLETDYPDTLLKKILDSERATLVLLPDKDIGGIRENETERALTERLGELTQEKLESIRKFGEEFSIWQSTPDTEEALATIPTLSLSDLADEPDEVPTEIIEKDGATLITHPIKTSGITYTDMYFDASDTEVADVPVLTFMGLLYSNLDTERGSCNDFRRRTKSALGSIALTTSAFKRGDEVHLYLLAKLSCLDARREDALELLDEYLYRVVLENQGAVRRAIAQYTALYYDMISESGHSIAIARTAAKCSRIDALKEYTSGYEFYRWLKSKKDATDEQIDELIGRMKELRERVFVSERLTVSVTGTDGKGFAEKCAALTKHGTPSSPSKIEMLPKKNEGIAIPSQVSYATLGGNLFDTGVGYHNGAWTVLGTLLDFQILWEEIRIKGGAYGTGFVSRANSGTTAFYSYRDPSAANTIDTYKRVPELIRELLSYDIDLEKFIIGTIGALDPVTTPSIDGSKATQLYLAAKSHEDVLRNRRECIGATKEGLIELADILDKVIKDSTVTVIGPRDALEQAGLDEILEL